MRYRMTSLLLIPSLLGAGLSGCTGKVMLDTHKNTVEAFEKMARKASEDNAKLNAKHNKAIPDAVSRALLTSKNSAQSSKQWHHFNLAVNNMPVRQFFTHLSSIESANIIVAPNVSGNITLNLNHVSLPEVLNAVSDSYGFQIEHKSFGYKVVKESLTTRIYTIGWLALSRSGSSTMDVNDVQNSNSNNGSNYGNGSNNNRSNNNNGDNSNDANASSHVFTHFGVKDYWKEITDSIEKIIAPANAKEGTGNASVTVNKANGLVVVRATPKAQKLVGKYLHTLNKTNSKQVIVDARIIEVELTKDQEIGVSELGFPFVKWSNSSKESTLSYQNSATKAAHDGFKDFSNIINTLSTVGHVSILSSPRLSILNNQKALIKVGEDEYYSLGSSTTYLSTGSGNVDPVSSNSFQSFFSGIALDVTPQIDEHNKITMHIHPIVSRVISVETKSKGETLDLPKTKIREADTIVSSKSGQVIVIGGLISEGSKLLHNKIPGAEENENTNTNRKDTYYKKELFILLRARVVDDKSWVNELDQVAAHFSHSGDTNGETR